MPTQWSELSSVTIPTVSGLKKHNLFLQTRPKVVADLGVGEQQICERG
jgi:hypothetical protein